MQARFDLAQAALEVSISADACADPHAFDALVAPAFAWLAADVHLIISVRVASAGPRLQIAYGRSSPAWEARYLAAVTTSAIRCSNTFLAPPISWPGAIWPIAAPCPRRSKP